MHSGSCYTTKLAKNYLVATFRLPTANFIRLWSRDDDRGHSLSVSCRFRVSVHTVEFFPCVDLFLLGHVSHAIIVTWPQAWWSSPLV